MRARLALLVCALLGIPFAAPASLAATPPAAPLEASLSRNWVSLGETFELTLRIVGDANAAPDLTPLERDFHLGGVNRISHTTISNGRLSKHQEWRVQLRARREGTFTIPSIEIPGVAGSASAPLEIEIAAGAARPAPPGAGPPAGAPTPDPPSVFVEAEVDRKAPYVQGQVLLKVRIASDRPLLSGSLTEPQVAGASIERMGEDRSFEETIDGRKHRIIEREYAIFPQQSGEMRIPPIEFEGRVRAPIPPRGRNRRGLQNSPFGALEDFMADGFFAQRGRSVRDRTEEIVLEVRARPEDATGRWWLPAEELRLSEEWNREPDTLQVGEQVTRSFVIQAFGVSRGQIPDIELPEVRGLKQYPEPVNDQTVRTDDGLASIKVQRTVVIPTEPGEVLLPAIELAWWDTTENRERIATLPERRIRVVAGAGDLARSPTPPETGATKDAGAGNAEMQREGPDDVAETDAAGAGADLRLRIALAAVVAIALLLALRAALRRRAGPATPSPRSGSGARASLRSAERTLARACSANDAEAAARALHEVGSLRLPDARHTSPGAFAESLGDPDLAAAVASLQAARFGTGRAASWKGATLWEAYARIHRRSPGRTRATAAVLPPLYPTR